MIWTADSTDQAFRPVRSAERRTTGVPHGYPRSYREREMDRPGAAKGEGAAVNRDRGPTGEYPFRPTMRHRHFLPGLTITAIAVSLVGGGCGGGSNRQSGASRAAATAATGPTLFVRPVLCTLPPALRPGGANVPPESACA